MRTNSVVDEAAQTCGDWLFKGNNYSLVSMVNMDCENICWWWFRKNVCVCVCVWARIYVCVSVCVCACVSILFENTSYVDRNGQFLRQVNIGTYFHMFDQC